MEKILKIFKDNGKIVIQYEQEPGKPHKTEQYWTMRGGISWPKTEPPGYYCILGLKDEPSITGKKPLVFQDEGESRSLNKFFDKIAVSFKRTCFDRLYAELDDKHKGLKNSFNRFVRKEKLEGIQLFDSSEFFDLDHGSLLIKQLKGDDALRIQKGTILQNQLGRISPDVSPSDLEKDFYAVAALIRVLISFEIYPWRKPSQQFTGFSNWEHRTKKDNNDGYQEYFVK